MSKTTYYCGGPSPLNQYKKGVLRKEANSKFPAVVIFSVVYLYKKIGSLKGESPQGFLLL